MVIVTTASIKDVCRIFKKTPTALYEDMSFTQHAEFENAGKKFYVFACLPACDG